jgi:hypothetical protein
MGLYPSMQDASLQVYVVHASMQGKTANLPMQLLSSSSQPVTAHPNTARYNLRGKGGRIGHVDLVALRAVHDLDQVHLGTVAKCAQT